MFDVFYMGDNPELASRLPFAKQVSDSGNIFSQTKMYWLIEPHVELIDTDVLNYRPEDHDSVYEHIWKWNSNNYGGVRLLPKGESLGVKEVNQIVCKKSFAILNTPDPGDYFTEHPYADYVWCVDPDYKLGTDINWAPGNFEPEYIHSFHLRGQLEHRYPESEGGIKLYPRAWQSAHTKYHGFLDANIKYPVLFVDDIQDYSQRDIYPDDYVWLIDSEHVINPDTTDWVPNPFEDSFIHCFRMPYQLTDKYPMAMGGIRLVPKVWKDAQIKIQQSCPIEDINYDVFFVDEDDFTSDVYNEYAERSKTDWFWIVDRDFDFNGKLLYVPGKHEQDYIHVFKIPDHLTERYPEEFTDAWDNRCGGVRLLHKDFDITKHKYHQNICPVRYDIFYSSDINSYELPSQKSRTKMFWLIDSEHELDNVFNFVPHRYDQKTVHIFKIPNQLTHKYPTSVTNVSDNRAGGCKLVPTKYHNADTKFVPQSPTHYKQYPIIYVDNVDNYEVVTQDCWLIDREYEFDNEVDWTPPDFQNNMIHTFHLGSQLRHKYPEAMGGIRWVPRNWKDAEVVIQDVAPFSEVKFEVFESITEGRAKSKHNWFWVVDSDVDVVTDFDWNFMPDTWDTGKTHVWQIANPVTGLQYDYQGVKLCHINPAGGRDKYIKQIASIQKVYDILHLDPTQDIIEQLNNYNSSTKMYWVVDPWVEIHPDFDFSFYPTQWDQDCVHVFTDENGIFRNVRLVPSGYEFENLEQITNNSFTRLKEHKVVASVTPEWPVYNFVEGTQSELREFANDTSQPWFFTIDSDVKLLEDHPKFEPQISDHSRVHAWQRINPHTRDTHSYGGVRLWPTHGVENITTDQIKLNKIPRLRYVREALSVYKPYPVVLLSYHEERAQTAFDTLKKRSHNAIWVSDVKGIFEAHKEAAKQAGDATMFWVVDADAELADDFTFSYIPDVYDQDVVHVWASLNPVTGSKYGYGGVKLFNTSQVNHSTSWGLDFTTGLSNRFKFMPQVSCTTKFNTSAYDTWRSAFREVVKLTVSSDPDAQYRIQEWMNPIPNAEFSQDAKRGAEQAQAFAKQNNNNQTELDKINDYEWLKKKYKQE